MKIITINKKININYEIIEKYEAGISLKGNEIKSVFKSETNINDAFGIISKNEIYLINMYVKSSVEIDANQRRKLLLHKSEIKKISYLIKKNKFTIIPTKIYLSNNKIKIEIAICKKIKKFDKRLKLKKKENIRYINKLKI